MNYIAIPTVADGLNFRSRLEASWYLFLKELGFSVLYEPDIFEIKARNNELLGKYVPDFYIDSQSCWSYVEIKPLLGEYKGHDLESISMACILGYTEPSIVVLGSPFRYFAFKISERYKGCPDGFAIEFGEGKIHERASWRASASYPDENGLDDMEDPRECAGEGYSYIEPEGYIRKKACIAWNQTQWQPET